MGPGRDGSSPYSGVISAFRHAIACGRTLVLNGDGGQTRDFVYVADVVAALVASMDRLCVGSAATDPAPRVFNVCTGRATSIRELAGLLGEATGLGAQVRLGPPRVGDIQHSLGDPRRLAEAVGVECRTEVRAGLGLLAAAGLGKDIPDGMSMRRMTR